MFMIRAQEEWPPGALDYAHYKRLHHHFFQDVYDWAGTIRSVRIAKQGNWFCYPEYIDAEMRLIFTTLAQLDHLVGLPAEDFARNAANILADINAVHPFREGNGRTQMAFLFILTRNAGFAFDEATLHRDRVIDAMVRSFAGNEAPLRSLILDLVGG